MDPETKAKRQNRRVIISEIIMVISVILMVTVLAFIVSGYWLGSDFKVERQGMLQISSIPTGANVAVDGDAPWYQRTNTSKVLASGPHEVVLTRDGYDSWSKTVEIREGLLYRLHYPRLFLKERTRTTAYDFSKATFATVSPDRTRMLVLGSAADWSLLGLESDTLVARSLDFTKFLPASFSAQSIISADWDRSGGHVLLKLAGSETPNWVLLNVNNPSESLNLAATFSQKFTELKILDNSSSSLLAVRSSKLYRIDVGAKKLSEPLVENLQSFDYFGTEIVYSALTAKDTAASSTSTVATDVVPIYEVGLLRLGSATPEILTTTTRPVDVLISEFYDDKYITLIDGTNIAVYRKDDFAKYYTTSISFLPTIVKVGHDGEFITFVKDSTIATLDMEALSTREWSLGGAHYGWLDDDMLYSVVDGELVVYDFDGLNRRGLASGVSTHFPVTIARNRWLYYVSGNQLIREIVAN